MLIIFLGMEYVKVFENWAAPIVLILAAALLIWVVILAGGLGPILT
jgi:NCS1 family nucleobase:cation symporter-1